MQNSDIPTTNSDTPKCEIIEQTRKRISRSKDELRYWKQAIRRVPNSPYWYAEIQRGGIRRKVSLETSNAAAAAHRAREIWYFVRAHGWPAYLAKFKPESVAQPDPTIAAFLAQVERTSDLGAKTLKSYQSALRKIVSDMKGLSDDFTRHGHGRGRQAWLERTGSVKLSELSPDAIQAWKVAFIARAGTDPLSTRSAKVSANTYLRCAKSLFGQRVIKHVKLELPNPLPFSDVQFEPRPSQKYRSTFSITGLVEAARTELVREPEVYKAFLLASFAGLRRKEIDLLEWSSFRWNECTIRIETTAHFSAKSEDSLGDVAVDRQLMDLFRGYHQLASGPFVIESSDGPRSGVLYNYYRAELVFDRLIQWLRAHRVAGNKPLHALRKEFGSEVCKHAGIYAASRALRHSDIKITCEHYVEARGHVTVGLGHLLETNKVIEFKEVA